MKSIVEFLVNNHISKTKTDYTENDIQKDFGISITYEYTDTDKDTKKLIEQDHLNMSLLYNFAYHLLDAITQLGRTPVFDSIEVFIDKTGDDFQDRLAAHAPRAFGFNFTKNSLYILDKYHNQHWVEIYMYRGKPKYTMDSQFEDETWKKDSWKNITGCLDTNDYMNKLQNSNSDDDATGSTWNLIENISKE